LEAVIDDALREDFGAQAGISSVSDSTLVQHSLQYLRWSTAQGDIFFVDERATEGRLCAAHFEFRSDLWPLLPNSI